MNNKPIIRVSAGAVVLNKKGEVLVVSQQGTSWSLPKGGVEGKETLEECLRREVYEETGIRNISIVKKLGSYNRFRGDENGDYDKSVLKEIHMYLCRTNELGLKPIDSDNPCAKWVTRDAVADLLTYKEDKEFYQSIIDEIKI